MSSSAPSSPRIRFLRAALDRGLLTHERLFGASSQEARTFSESEWIARYEELAAQGTFLGDAWEALHQEVGLPSDLPPSDPLQGFPDSLRDRFEPLECLGKGGMGVVYKAMDHRLHRAVALKFLRHLDPETQDRFLREARAQARMEHPCIGGVYEVVQDAERPYLVLQCIDGPTLAQVRGKLGLEETVRIFRQLAEALHECHRAGVLHRDIKPGNVMLERLPEGGWHPYLVDFGLARHLETPSEHTVPGIILGTPAYASPEALRGAKVDRRSDVYGLGATLYDALTGRPPFDALSTWSLLQEVQTRDPEPPSRHRPGLPRDLETVVLKTLEKDPAARYDSARAFGDDLQRYLDGDPVSAHPAGPIYRFRKRLRKLGPIRYLLAVLLLAAVGGAGFGLWSAQRTRTQSRLAQAFGGEVDRLESELYRELSLPHHNVRPELDRVQARIAELQSQLGDYAGWVQAPARRALGRGFMALGRLDEAKVELQTAWVQSREKDPETAAALGLTLARIFQEELEGLRGKAREDKRKELDQRLREPALRCLRLSEGATSVSRTFIEAVLANVEGQEDLALARLQQVKTEQPWNPESWLLEAEIRRVQGGTALARGDFKGAEAATRRALEAVARARDILRSSPRVYEAEAHCTYQLLWIRADQGLAGEEDRQAALAASDRALEVDPGNWRAWSIRSSVHRHWAVILQERHENPAEAFDAAQQDAERGLAVHGLDNALWNSYATLLRSRAEWELSEGRDPRPTLGKAIEALKSAMTRPQLRDFLLNNLGNCLSIQAEWELRHGQDPQNRIEEASTCLQEAMALRPWVGHAASEGGALVLGAHYRRWSGGNPTPLLERAQAAYDRALDLNPNSYLAHQWMAQAGVLQARWNPAAASRALSGAERHARRALELNPKAAPALLALAEVDALSDRAPAAQEKVARALAMDPGLGESALSLRLRLASPAQLPSLLAEVRALRKRKPEDGELALHEGRILGLLGQSKASEALLLKAEHLNPNLKLECRRPRGEW
jgi:serine/threonine-protein kinase